MNLLVLVRYNILLSNCKLQQWTHYTVVTFHTASQTLDWRGPLLGGNQIFFCKQVLFKKHSRETMTPSPVLFSLPHQHRVDQIFTTRPHPRQRENHPIKFVARSSLGSTNCV